MKKLSKHIEIFKKSSRYSQITWYRIKDVDGLTDALAFTDERGQHPDIIIRSNHNPEYFDILYWSHGFWFIYRHDTKPFSKPEKIDVYKIDFNNQFVGFLNWTGPWIGSKEELNEIKI